MDTLTHSQIGELAKLRTRSRDRREQGRFFVEGVKLLEEAVASGWAVESLVVTSAASRRYLKLLSGFPNTPVSRTDEAGMGRLSGVQTPPEILAVLAIPETHFEDVATQPLVACLDGIADPGNLGTIIRTADWFGVTGLILDASGVDPYNDKVVRSTMGSLFHVKIWESRDMVGDLMDLKRRGTKLLVTDVHGESSAVPAGPLCLVMGGESHGVREEVAALADKKYTIPGSGKAESLNLAVSFGIALHDIASRR